MEANQRLSQEHVFCHEFGLAFLKVCQRPKPGEKQCLVLSRGRAQWWSASCQPFDESEHPKHRVRYLFAEMSR